MVSLYKDPDEHNVFEVRNEALEVPAIPNIQRQKSDMEVLKQRIKQLEDELNKHVTL